MAVILDCAAEKLTKDNKLIITFIISKNYESEDRRQFLLPEEKSSFMALTDELYENDFDIIPSKFDKKENGKAVFFEKFISYTVQQNLITVDEDELNDYYEDLFSFDAKDMAAIDGFRNKQEAEIQSIIEAQEKEMEDVYIPPLDEVEDPSSFLEINEDYFTPLEIMPKDRGFKPKTSSKKPVVELNGLTENDKEKMKSLPMAMVEELSGIDRTKLKEPTPSLMDFADGKSLEGRNNTLLNLSRDPKYGLRGHTGAGAAYLVAGRSPHDIQTEEKGPDGNRLANTKLYKPNDLVNDASYVFLSQKSDSKALMPSIPGGTYEKVVGESAYDGDALAAIQSDAVIIGAKKAGVRIVGGQITERSANSGEIASSFGVDLISGKDPLQPMVTGNDLVMYLQKLSKAVSDLQGVCYKQMLAQNKINAAAMDHNHYDPFLITLGTALGLTPDENINKSKNLPSEELKAAGKDTLFETLVQQQSFINTTLNRINADLMALEKFGSNHILSQRNKTN